MIKLRTYSIWTQQKLILCPQKFFLDIDLKWLVCYPIMPWETGWNVPSIMSHLELLQEYEREFSPSACVLCDPATVRQRDLQPCLRACVRARVSAASACGPPCAWVMPAALTVDQSVYRSSADQLGPPSVCWRCPAASSTTDSATSSGDRPDERFITTPVTRSQNTHLFCSIYRQKVSRHGAKKKKRGKKWIQGSFITGCMTSPPNLNTNAKHTANFFFLSALQMTACVRA